MDLSAHVAHIVPAVVGLVQWQRHHEERFWYDGNVGIGGATAQAARSASGDHRADRWTLDAHDIEGADTAFSAITYDTRDVREGTLLCCKGRFKAEYLHDIDERGLAAYVADTDFSAETGTPGLIVNDARKAMSLLSAEFYGRPQDELTVVGITGTKGKTTTAYFTQPC